MRASELERLKWRDLDLEHGRLRLDENTTDDPRAWALSPDVVRALVWWRRKTKGEPDDLVLRANLQHGARFLRGPDDGSGPGDLQRAGITRAELFERSASRQPLRLHDLRATFVTVSLANGRTEQWVTDRTGHKSSAMVALYARQARTWGELRLGALGPLDGLIPEVKGTRGGAKGGTGSGNPGGRDWVAIGSQVTGGVAEWSKAAVLKTADLVRDPGVRIPSPPLKLLRNSFGRDMWRPAERGA